MNDATFQAWLTKLFGEAEAARLLREIRMEGFARPSWPHTEEHNAPPVSAEVEAFIQSTMRRKP